MGRFCFKRVEVEAVRYDGSFELAFLRHDERVGVAVGREDAIHIESPNRDLYVDLGYWVVREPNGDLAQYSPEDFEATFEPFAAPPS